MEFTSTPRNRSRTLVEDTREREGVAAVPRLRQLLQQVRTTVCETRGSTHESAEEEYALQWETKHEEAVEQLKQALTSAPVLILPDPERDYVIEADASDQAVEAVLMQDQGNGLQPIAYLSKKLHGTELNYPIHDKGPCHCHRLQSVEMLSRRTKNNRLHRPLQPEIFEDTTNPFQAAGPVDRLPRDTLPLRHRVQARPQEQSRRSQPACTLE
ncbi:hypothetical protein CLOM_g16394 [Closterium sp. NIES-68]|nr:hypothetical protein CLOM_g16394 [Closterium sp. NIES-68]